MKEIEEIREWMHVSYSFTRDMNSTRLNMALQMLERALDGIKCAKQSIELDADTTAQFTLEFAIKDIHAMLPKETK